MDACKAGWFTVILSDRTDWEINIFPNMFSLWNQCRDVGLILIDVPIGLREIDSKERSCDKEARKLLGPERGTSVFPAPCRAAVYAATNDEAKIINAQKTGRSLSEQTLAIIPKIREVDKFLNDNISARSRIREIHPEVCFWALNGFEPMRCSKKAEEGYLERTEVLCSVYPYTEDLVCHALKAYSRSRLSRDDILDALVAAVTASKGRQGLLTIPENPEADSKGLPMEMVYYPMS